MKVGWLSPIEAPDGYKMVGVVEEILLTFQGLISPSRFLLFSPRHQSQDRHIPPVHISLFFEE